MILTALARLGRDAEVRHTPKGEAVANLALAINYGRKGSDGNRPTQWVEASLWGARAESLAPHLMKGKLLYVVIEEPHIERSLPVVAR
jgi:single-strand DNA-binding protein